MDDAVGGATERPTRDSAEIALSDGVRLATWLSQCLGRRGCAPPLPSYPTGPSTTRRVTTPGWRRFPWSRRPLLASIISSTSLPSGMVPTAGSIFFFQAEDGI